MPESNRGYEAAYLSKGERALIVRALRFFMSAQQQMISESAQKYREKNPQLFASHQRTHQQQIEAAGALFERFRTLDYRKNPDQEGEST